MTPRSPHDEQKLVIDEQPNLMLPLPPEIKEPVTIKHLAGRSVGRVFEFNEYISAWSRAMPRYQTSDDYIYRHMDKETVTPEDRLLARSLLMDLEEPIIKDTQH